MDYKKIYNDIEYYKKRFSNIYECILKILDKEINLLERREINEKSIIFKNKLGNDLLNKKIYKLFDYNLKKQKNIIYTFLISNNIYVKVPNIILEYISIYLNCNILIIKNKLYRFINNYDENKKSIILIEKEDKYMEYIYKTNEIYKELFDDNDIKNIIKNFNINYEIIINEYILFSTQFNKIKKKTLDEIENICKFYNIELYNNNKKKNRKDLLNELYDILYNI